MAERKTSDGWIALDAWPVMQWFRAKTPGDTEFRALLSQACEWHRSLCISRMSLGGVYSIVTKDSGEKTASLLVQQPRALSIDGVTVTNADIDAAAVVKGRCRIAYADAFAAVLSESRKASIATGDPEFKAVAADGVLALRWVSL